VKRKKTTIEDVAALAGVSRQTVSRVVNDRDLVADETRARVLAAIEALDYRPNASARSLASRRTYVLGIVTADFSDYTHARIIEGAEAEAQNQGYLFFVSSAEHGPDGEPLHSPLLSQHQTEGLLIVYHGSEQDTHAIFEEIPHDLPVVTIGYAEDREHVVTVSITNAWGARQATSHLLGLGHRRIAHVTGPPKMYESKKRRFAYTQALQEANIVPDDRLVAKGDWSSASGYRATMELIGREVDFTAMFIQNDRMTMGVLQALREHKLRVPQDIAVVGFDDIPSARYFSPPLTTIHHPFSELGRTGTRLLIDLVNGQPAPSEPIRLETSLVVRRSCGARNGNAGARSPRP
jgi:DNA-binding LacI/PurR family transcriptional regulator